MGEGGGDKVYVINLFGAPGTGKSCGAAYIFSKLKMVGVNCELVTGVAKDLTWEENEQALACQEYIFGKQSFRMKRCRDKVDVIITDSPLPLSIFYNDNPVLDESYEDTVMKVFNSYDNHNYVVQRWKPYNSVDRNQTQAEADEIGDRIEFFLDDYNVPYTIGLGRQDYYDSIVEDCAKYLDKPYGVE